ncbi:MAG: UDP-N-acetylmuramoyl-L-alanyl-D-glutamate--2,6-diaminopimelate ligase [Alphaproteobacteria bacterium]|nr:UDP-N-acetylmuramoyl-L-alanyl-D-glutamate--2,6-diaminopimelate ligase [Alphaproteobacteria bacterium]
MNLTEVQKILSLSQSLPDLEIKGISEKANDIREGFIFVAVKGTKVDGADFIPQAEKNGAVIVIADHDVQTKLPVIIVQNPRDALAQIALHMYPSEQLKKVAVTGTNGKTSIVYYVSEIVNALKQTCASMGTIGVSSPVYNFSGHMTTPDVVTLNQTFHTLQTKGVQVVALEASSHGLCQGRLKGHRMQAAAFTNLTRDHLDFHKTMENYLQAKSLLFSEYLEPNGTAVLNADIPEYDALKRACPSSVKIISYGKKADTLQLISQTPTQKGQDIVVKTDDKEFKISLGIYGDFQAMNILAAVGLCMGLGMTWQQIYPILSQLTPPAGRLEKVGETPVGAQVFIDYAHTPDALERVLKSLRPHTKNQLVCLFGCGGDRDTGKRPQMGKIADELADVVYITDDNPRTEDPEKIRQAIKDQCPKGIVVDNRGNAIRTAIQNLQAGDVLVLAGKGHESGQIINGITYPFNDKIESLLVLKELQEKPLWTHTELSLALNTQVDEKVQGFGVTFNTQELKTGDIFIALTGGKRDGHLFVREAMEKGAAACIVSTPQPDILPDRQIVVPDTIFALQALARFARMRTEAVVIGVTGSCGKTTTKEMLKACFSAQGKTHATFKDFNNHLGVPLTLANMPALTQYAVIEMGMSHKGEMTELSDLVRPNISLITNIAPAHQEFFINEQEIACAKADIMDFQDKNGVVVLNKDDAFYQFLADASVVQKIKKIITFGADAKADFQLVDAMLEKNKTRINLKWHEDNISFSINFIGFHFISCTLACLATIDAAGASVNMAIESFQTLYPMVGRGSLEQIVIDGKNIQIIDDAYNANPNSMKAGIIAFGLREGHKIAVLGDMLELGTDSLKMHLDLLPILAQNGIMSVYATGPLMQHVINALPEDIKGKWVESLDELSAVLRRELQAGDVVLFKASHAIGLEKVIQQLKGE